MGEHVQGLGNHFVDQLAIRDQHPARRTARQGGVVGDDEDGLALVGQLAEDGQHMLGSARIQVAGRLIGHDDGRVIGQGAGNGGDLLLPARERQGQLIGLPFQAHQLEQLHGAPLALGRGIHVAIIHRQHGVFEHRKGGQQLEELEDNAQGTAAPFGHLALAHAVDLGLAHPHRACGGMVNAGDHVDQS